ncbi:hypothetical protein ABTN14_20120, partial [Acinetobacter baumannii]
EIRAATRAAFDRNGFATTTNGTIWKVRFIVRSYCPDFGFGATLSFCSRQEDGAVGRKLVYGATVER